MTCSRGAHGQLTVWWQVFGSLASSPGNSNVWHVVEVHMLSWQSGDRCSGPWRAALATFSLRLNLQQLMNSLEFLASFISTSSSIPLFLLLVPYPLPSYTPVSFMYALPLPAPSVSLHPPDPSVSLTYFLAFHRFHRLFLPETTDSE